jgi:hypothetical protein
VHGIAADDWSTLSAVELDLAFVRWVAPNSTKNGLENMSNWQSSSLSWNHPIISLPSLHPRARAS